MLERRSFHFIDTYLTAFYKLDKGQNISDKKVFPKNSSTNRNNIGEYDSRSRMRDRKQVGVLSGIKTFFFYAFQ